MFTPLLIAAAGVCLRIAFVIPAIHSGDHGVFERPDSGFYLYAAHELAEGKPYPGSTRTPGFSAVAAILLKTTGTIWSVPLFFAVAGGTGALLIYFAGKEYADRKTGILAEILYSFNLTSIVNAPMLLTDTFFGILAAWQFLLFVQFRKHDGIKYFLWSVAVSSLGSLIRPINMMWIFPAVFMLCLHRNIPWKKKIISGLAALFIFAAIPSPWMTWNAMRGAGYCLDTNTGAMLHQNGSMLLAEVNGTEFEYEKAKMLKKLDEMFQDKKRFPDEKSIVDYRKKEYISLILKHPFTWLKQQFQWKILLPDVPTGFEILGITSAGRGTMGVLAKDGFPAAVNHYFNGKILLPLNFAPLLIISLATAAGCLIYLIALLKKLPQHYYELFLFLAFAEYYFFLPGAITAPRYQIPALPVITVFASCGLLMTYDFVQKFYRQQKARAERS